MKYSPARALLGRLGRRLRVVLLLAIPALAGMDYPASALANESPGTDLVVTWPDILRLIDRHPRLAAGAFQVEAARRGVGASGSVPNPTFEGNLGRARAWEGDAERTEWGLAVTLPLGWINQRAYRVDAAKADVEVAVAESSALRRDVVLQLRTLFWNLAYGQAQVASLEALVGQTSELVQTVTKRVEKGEARPVEGTRVEIELEKIASELETARGFLSARREELALWLGAPIGSAVVVVVDLETLPAAVDLSVARTKLRQNHPALALARARTRISEAEVGAETMARVPSFSVSGFTASELDSRAYGGGMTVDLPLWNWNSGRIAQAKARLAADRKQAEASALEAEASLFEVQAACETSVLTATRFRSNLVPRSETAASIMKKTYELGEASLLELIDARRTLLDSRRLYLSALAQAQIDCSRLVALIGEESK